MRRWRPARSKSTTADYRAGNFRGFDDQSIEIKGNICQEVHIAWGDVEKAFASAAHIAEGEFYFPMIYAYAMEPYVAIADYDAKGKLTVYSSAQHPFMVRQDLADVFGLPLNNVRVIVPFVGGGYGSKSYTKIEPLVAACSWKSGRPVKLQLSVEEAFLTTRGDDARVRIRTAVDAQGKLVARQATIHFDTGAYAENSPMVARKATNRIVGPYRIPNVKIDSYAVYTNTVPASSYRGLGAAQVTFPGESQMDELAEKLRMRSGAVPAEESGESRRVDQSRGAADRCRCSGRLARNRRHVADGKAAARRGHGRSICCSASDAGAHPVTLAMVQVYGDGSVSVLSGSTEIGQGSHTVLAQIAAEEMGVPFEKSSAGRIGHGDHAFRALHRRQPHHHADGPRRSGSLPRSDRADARPWRRSFSACRSESWSKSAAACATERSGSPGPKFSRNIFRCRAAASSAAPICGARAICRPCRCSGKSAWWASRSMWTRKPGRFAWIRSRPSATWAWRSIRR